MRVALRFLALLSGLVFATALQAQSNDFQEATRLLKQGQHGQALNLVNQYLATRPRDAQGRFLKGLILIGQNKQAEAIDVFSRLSQDYPSLPEPYNNLAVLYERQGQYEKASQALEMSIRTQPGYAMAYENLGDVYTELARQAYDKALQLDSSNSVAQSKLSLVRKLISGGGRSAHVPTEATRVSDSTKSRASAAKIPEK